MTLEYTRPQLLGLLREAGTIFYVPLHTSTDVAYVRVSKLRIRDSIKLLPYKTTFKVRETYNPNEFVLE